MNEDLIQPQFPEQYAFHEWNGIYFEPSDILTVHFGGVPRPAISIPASDEGLAGLYWRIDPVSHVAVGIEIMGFLSSFLFRHPEAVGFADLAGIPEESIMQALATIDSAALDRAIFSSLAGGLRTGNFEFA